MCRGFSKFPEERHFFDKKWGIFATTVSWFLGLKGIFSAEVGRKWLLKDVPYISRHDGPYVDIYEKGASFYFWPLSSVLLPSPKGCSVVSDFWGDPKAVERVFLLRQGLRASLAQNFPIGRCQENSPCLWKMADEPMRSEPRKDTNPCNKNSERLFTFGWRSTDRSTLVKEYTKNFFGGKILKVNELQVLWGKGLKVDTQQQPAKPNLVCRFNMSSPKQLLQSGRPVKTWLARLAVIDELTNWLSRDSTFFFFSVKLLLKLLLKLVLKFY